MRGQFLDQGRMFSYLSPEERVPKGHPLRAVRAMVRSVLEDMHGDFAKLYSSAGRPSIPPEQLLSALLLQVFYGIRSERQLMEQLDYNLLYRWFVGLDADAAVWVATSFTKNRERLQQGDIFQRFMTVPLHRPNAKPLLSDEHFSVDGTSIEARASHGSFQPKDGSGGPALAKAGGADFHKQKRSNDTHASVTDPESRLYKKAKGKESKLCYMGHALMENRNGLAVGGTVTHATGTAEREASEAMLAAKVKQTGKRATVGEDKAYDAASHGAAPSAGSGQACENSKSRRMSPEATPSPRPASGARASSRTPWPQAPVTPCRRRAASSSNACSDGASSTAHCARPNIEASLR